MDAITHTIIRHPFMVLAGWAVFSNLVGAMDPPTEKSGPVYRFIYRFAHGLAQNILYAVKAKFPKFVEASDHAEAQAGK